MPTIESLTLALQNIQKLAETSRTQSRRLIYIAARAKSALNDDDSYKENKYPATNIATKYQKLRQENMELKRQLAVRLNN